jgi:hypothetical protein
MSPLAVLALGFVLGLRHATDADHVVAVTTLVSRERSARSALTLGAAWGVGHGATLLLVGGAMVAFGLVVPPRVGLSLELAVALMLMLLGAWNLRGGTTPAGALAPGGAPRSLAVGVVHGLAGSAALALLALTTLKSVLVGLGYLAVFGLGTVAGMLLVTAALALPLRLATTRFFTAERLMARATGMLSIALGLFIAYRIGFVDGLLLGDPKWTPE